MNKLLQEKIKRYSIAAGAVAAATGANAQIVWTEIVPDRVLNVGESFTIDLDGDLTNDFTLFVDTYTYSTTSSTVDASFASIDGSVSGYNNQVMYTSSYVSALSTSISFASALSLGSAINNSQTWTYGSALLGAKGTVNGFPIAFGEFRGTGDKYIGVRIEKGGGNWLYGWIRVQLNADANQLIIKDYAVETTLNTGINAGEGSTTSLAENSLEGKVRVGTSEGNVVINLNGVSSANTKIISATGQELAKTSISEGATEISVNGASGLCIVEVSNGDAVIRKKVMLN